MEGAQRLSISPFGGLVAISNNKRRLVIFERHARQFTLSKDISPLKLIGPGKPAAQPTWFVLYTPFPPAGVVVAVLAILFLHLFLGLPRLCVFTSALRAGEDKLLLPGTSQLRCISSRTGWGESEELPSLPGGAGLARELLLLQSIGCDVATAAPHQRKDANEGVLIGGVATDGTVGVWRMQQAEPLMLLPCQLDVPFLYCSVPAFRCVSLRPICFTGRSPAQESARSPDI